MTSMTPAELLTALEEAATALHRRYAACSDKAPEAMTLELALTHLVTSITMLRGLEAPEEAEEFANSESTRDFGPSSGLPDWA